MDTRGGLSWQEPARGLHFVVEAALEVEAAVEAVVEALKSSEASGDCPRMKPQAA